MTTLYSNQGFTVDVTTNGQCMDFTVYNAVTTTMTSRVDLIYEGHSIIIEPKSGDIPDIVSVVPMAGWEAITDLVVHVAEKSHGVVTICQMLLG